MQDEGFEKRIRFGQLYAIYGGLLTEKQQKIMEEYFYDDLSLGDIDLILSDFDFWTDSWYDNC